MADRRARQGDIETRTLSDALTDQISKRKVQTAVFFTYRFDPGFFEQEIVPVLFDEPLSHAPAIRLVNLETRLRAGASVSVYYDRGALEAGSSSAKLDVRRIAVSRSTGYFHPKNILLLVEKPMEGEDGTDGWAGSGERSLIVGSLSANLTRAGWWENVEVAHFEEVVEGSECSFRNDLLALISRVRGGAPQEKEHADLESIRSFIRHLTQAPTGRRQRYRPRLYSGGEPLVEFLKAHTGRRLRDCRLEIVSPYFDERDSSGPVEALLDAFSPVETRIVLPRGPAGEAQCRPKYHERMQELGLVWSALPEAVMRSSAGAPPRRLHAKIYRFFDPRRRYEAVFSGSANLTTAAFSGSGNVESGFLLEAELTRRPGWWLQPDEQEVIEFDPQQELQDDHAGPGRYLSLQFDWDREEATAFWDRGSDSPVLRISANGVELFSIGPLAAKTWTELENQKAEQLEDVLQSTSFLRVDIEGHDSAMILVEEVEMALKPSLMMRLTVAEILRYWSLLTSEQKKQFLEERLQDLDATDAALWITPPRVERIETFFDGFAGIFHSFGNLERALFEALTEDRERDAVARLFGRSFDSLQHLVTRVLCEEEGDVVNRYVILLCAKQLLRRLKKDEPAFWRARRSHFQKLEDQLKQTRKLRSSLDIGKPSERKTFLDWFEQQFLKDVRA